jgi:hypothetical protein
MLSFLSSFFPHFLLFLLFFPYILFSCNLLFRWINYSFTLFYSLVLDYTATITSWQPQTWKVKTTSILCFTKFTFVNSELFLPVHKQSPVSAFFFISLLLSFLYLRIIALHYECLPLISTYTPSSNTEHRRASRHLLRHISRAGHQEWFLSGIMTSWTGRPSASNFS